MRILYLSHYYLSERASSSYLAENRLEAFANAGFDVDLYVPCDNGLNKRNSKAEYLYDGKVCIHRFSTITEKENHFLRALRYFVCCIKQFYLSLKADDFQLIFAPSTPPIQGAMVSCLKKIRKRPFVYNLQDIFPDSLVGVGIAKKEGLLWKIGRVIEDFTYRNADKIIVISEDFKRNIMAKGVPEEKIEVIYNWVDEKAVIPIEDKENPLFDELGISKDMFKVVYAGNLGNAQNLKIVIQAAELLEKRKDIEFFIFGKGGSEDDLRAEIASKGLSNVRLFPLQPYERVSYVYSLGNACLVSCKAGLGGSALPSKTWSILSAGRPVIASFDEGELKDTIETNDIGVFTKADDVDDFVKGILFLSENQHRCIEMGKKGREYILTHLTKEVGTQKYVDIIKSFDKSY